MGCFFPFKVDNPKFGASDDAPAKIPVPCGKCPYCLQRRANNWVFRCMQEAKVSDSSIWCTFTYETPPMTKTNMMTLRKRCFQLFIKRLRRSLPLANIKYYACGEYGDTYERPHFHAIIFNADADSIEKAWNRYVDGTIRNGFVTFDEVNERTVMYTAKYMNKGKLIPKFEGDIRLPEFQLFSKGLGISYLTEAKIAYHKADTSRLFTYVDGHKKALPRYFRLKIYDEEERAEQAELAQKVSTETYEEQYAEFLKSRAPGQTFEEFRYSRKEMALSEFRKKVASRKKFK